MMVNNLLRRNDSVSSWGDLSWFIVALLEDHEENPDQWNNHALYPFLDAMVACIAEMGWDNESNLNSIPEDQPWRIFAEILYAAKVYE